MATFETLAAKCAAGVALDLLVAIASVESGVDPLAVRAGAALTRVASTGEGVAIAVGAADQGREVRIGLMGLSERQLRAAGLTLSEGFDACASLSVAAGLIEASRATVRGQSADVADRVAIRAWWRSDGRFASVWALEAAVVRERAIATGLVKREIASASATLQASSTPGETTGATASRAPSQRAASDVEPNCWDIFARQRAGLVQCEDTAGAPSPTHDQRLRRPEPETASVVIFGSRASPR